MPKIPTYTARTELTTAAPSVRTDIQISPTQTAAAGLASIAKVAEDYYIKQRDNVEKLEARKKYYEMKSESDKIIESYKNNPDEFISVQGYNEEFGIYRDQQLSQIKNKRVRKRLENLLDIDQAENVYKIKSNSFDAFEEQEKVNYENGQTILANEYILATDEKTKQIKLNKRIQLAEEYENTHKLGNTWLGQAISKIKGDAELLEIEKAIDNNQFAIARELLSESKNIDTDQVKESLSKIEKQYNISLYYEGFKTGNDYLIGSDEDNEDSLKSIEEMAMRENFGKKNDAELFISVDSVFSKVGRLSPSYKQLLKQGVLSSPADGIPTPQIIRALRIADAADQSGRLDEYTTGEELKFYRSYLAARRIKGKTESEAYEMAVKAKDISLKLSSLPQYQRKRQTTFKEIRNEYGGIKSTNLTQILSYGESLFDLYIGLGSSPDEARKQVSKDLKKDIRVIDDYGYLKRDINPYKSIDGLDNIKPTKEFIIEKYLPEENPDDFYLTYTGAGEFAIYNRDVPHIQYNDEGMPMLFNYNQMISFKNQIKEKKKDVAREQLTEKEIRIKERQRRLSELKESKVPSGFGEPSE